MLATQSTQKSYADPKRRDIDFQMGDMLFLRISPMKGIKRFGKKGKLSPRCIGHFEILERIGQVAYKLAIPPALPALSYEEQPMQILDKKGESLEKQDNYNSKGIMEEQ
ncbi:uncharacterized protein LOC133036899 [Cannabis sativa]|uniref:uncharacterized protein LOC133036899 n=1 Tax=Cannabis sativa TaxID=3483 RepID=UPI0029CA0C95|nr:uncharacterized protein LOC133036899 [Cannabis sativa]